MTSIPSVARPTVLAVRAVSAEFVRRKLVSLALPIAIGGGILLAIAFWLTTVSAWWWLAAVPLISLIIVGVVAYALAQTVIKIYRPELTKKQRTDVSGFVDKLERVSEQIETPIFIIIFRIVRDVVRPREKSYIQEVAEDSTTLHTDFLSLLNSFKS